MFPEMGGVKSRLLLVVYICVDLDQHSKCQDIVHHNTPQLQQDLSSEMQPVTQRDPPARVWTKLTVCIFTLKKATT